MLPMNTSKRIAKWKIISLQKKIPILTVVNLQVLNCPGLNCQSLMGMCCNFKTFGTSLKPQCTSDHFRFLAPGGIVLTPDPITKRSLLSLASKMFDPLGLISPFTVRAKIFFQELWLKGLLWDDPLDSEIKAKWLHWKSELLQLKGVTIPRCFGNGITQESKIELHGFGDASPKAYGAAVYIRIADKQGHVSSQLVISKSRVAPIKKVSLPRLELLAAVVNARLLKFVVDT